MLKKITLMAAIALTGIVAKAQTNVGANTAPNASAILQATSTTKGFLPPVLTTGERDLITTPATGLVIFNSTTNQMEVNTGTPVSPVWTSTNATAATAAAAATPTIYTANGTLTSARTLTMGTNTLNFTGANVGIGAATPASALTINNNLSVGTGYAAIAAPTNGAIFQGNVGIGTSAPTAVLDVNGAARIRSIPAVPSSTTVFPIYADASGNVLSGPAAITAGTPGTKTYYKVTSLAAGATSAQIQFSPGFGVFKIYVRTVTASAQNAVAEFLFSGNNNTAGVGLKVISSTIDFNTVTADNYVYSNAGGSILANVQFANNANGTTIPNFTLRTGELTVPNLQFTITNNCTTTQSYNILCEQVF